MLYPAFTKKSTPRKVVQVLRGSEERGKKMRAKDRQRKKDSQDRRKRDFRPFETLPDITERERSFTYTRLKAISVCVCVSLHTPPDLPPAPQFVKGDPRCRLQDSKFVSDKQNKHATASSASVSSPFFSFSLSPEQKKAETFFRQTLSLRYILHCISYTFL